MRSATAFITGASTFVLILMLASLPFLHSSRPGFQAETTMAKTKSATQGLEINQVDVFGNGGSVLGVDEESARQVPTGSDPLHNKYNPVRP